MKTPYHTKGKSRLLIDFSSVSYIYPHLAHFLPVYGIISRCPMYRIQVASDSADNQLAFNCFSNSSDRDQKFNSQLRSSLEYGLDAGSNPRHLSIWVSPPESCYSRWKHRCSRLSKYDWNFDSNKWKVDWFLWITSLFHMKTVSLSFIRIGTSILFWKTDWVNNINILMYKFKVFKRSEYKYWIDHFNIKIF